MLVSSCAATSAGGFAWAGSSTSANAAAATRAPSVCRLLASSCSSAQGSPVFRLKQLAEPGSSVLHWVRAWAVRAALFTMARAVTLTLQYFPTGVDSTAGELSHGTARRMGLEGAGVRDHREGTSRAPCGIQRCKCQYGLTKLSQDQTPSYACESIVAVSDNRPHNCPAAHF